MTSLAGKHILVTGATGGLGARVSRMLIEAGATVSLSGRNEERLNQFPASTSRYTVDLSVPGASRALIAAVTASMPLDGVVAMHGAVSFGSVIDEPSEISRQLTAVNLDSVIELIAAATPLLKVSAENSREPFIMTVSGVIADLPTMGMASYGASKAGLKSFVQAASRELRRLGIRLLDARPGHTNTELSLHPLAGVAPSMSGGLDPDSVARRMVEAIISDEKDIPADAFN